MNRVSQPLTLRVVAATFCLVLISCAQQPVAPGASMGAAPKAAAPSSAKGAAQTPAPPVPAVDPGVLEALDRMGAFLRTLKNFEVSVSSTTDEMLENDQVAQVSNSAKLKVRRPDGMQAEMVNDRGDRRVLVYNGKTATLYDPQTRYYATVQAPATLKEVIDLLSRRYGIELPATDLFSWGVDKVNSSAIRSADFLGEALIDGKVTDQFALRQDGFDWQIWIEQGSTPLPRKLVIITTSEAARPQHSVLMRWNLSPKFAARIFDFKPPAGSYRIVVQKVDGTPDAPGK